MADNIHKGHRERMRQKFKKLGFEGFESHEILEMLLFYALPRINTNDIAHRLLDKYDSIKAVFDADLEDLKDVEGINESSAILLKMIPYLAREYISSDSKKIYLNNYKAVYAYFKKQFFGEKKEKIRIVCLDNKLRLVAGKVIAEGSPGGVAVNIKSIVEYTCQNKCGNIIIAHNHPNGSVTPSDEDIKSTAKVYIALKNVGFNLLDHIIVSGNQAISLKESGAFALLE